MNFIYLFIFLNDEVRWKQSLCKVCHICYSKSFHYYGVFQRLFSLSRMKRSWKYVISCLTHETKGNCKKEYYYLKCKCFCLV